MKKSIHFVLPQNKLICKYIKDKLVSKHKQVKFYNFTTNEFTDGPSMQIGRFSHACALFKNPKNCKQTVLVAGGIEKPKGTDWEYTYTAEILEISSTCQDDAWKESKSIFC